MTEKDKVKELEQKCAELDARVAELNSRLAQELMLRERTEAEHSRFVSIAENSGDLICTFAPEGELFYINRAGRDLVNIDSRNVAEVKSVFEFIHPVCIPDLKNAVAAAIRTGSFRDEVALAKLGSGEKVDVLIELFTVPDIRARGGVCIGAVMQDMREYKRFHEGIIANESNAMALMNAITESAYFMDPDGKIIAANETVIERSGRWCDEFIGQNLFDVLPDDVAGSRRRYMNEALATKKPVRFEDVVGGRIMDSVFYPVLDSLENVTGFAVFGRDVTEEKKAIDELRASEDRFRRAILESPFPIILHTEDGAILLVSHVWSELTGYTMDEIDSMYDWTEKAYREKGSGVREKIHRLYTLNKRCHEGEFEVMTAAGEKLWWDFSTAPIGVMPDGRKIVVSIAMDVTERNRAREELEHKNAELSIMYLVSSILGATMEPETIFEQVVEAISGLDDIIIAGRGALFIELQGRLELISQIGYSDDFGEKHRCLMPDVCYCGRAAKTGATVVSADSLDEAAHAELCPDPEPHGHIIVPLKSRGKTYGVLALCTKYGSVPRQSLVDLLETLAIQIGFAIENARLFQETKNLALHDALTGLGNRRFLEVLLDKYYSRARRTGDPFAIIMADIDHFKKYNDEHGHDEGDRILAAVAKTIDSHVREMDVAVRYGGEEFLILVPDVDKKEAGIVAERICAAVRNDIGVTISLGVASYTDGASTEEVIKLADNALYEAKRTGRDKVVISH